MDIQVNYAEVIQCSCAFSCHLFIFEYGSNVSVGYHQNHKYFWGVSIGRLQLGIYPSSPNRSQLTTNPAKQQLLYM